MKTKIKGDFQICISVPLTWNINLASNCIHRIIFKEAAPEVKEATQSTCAEDFFESPFWFWKIKLNTLPPKGRWQIYYMAKILQESTSTKVSFQWNGTLPATSLNKDPNTRAFLWISQNFWKQLCFRASMKGCFQDSRFFV